MECVTANTWNVVGFTMVQANALREFKPDVVVGSSYGGLVVRARRWRWLAGAARAVPTAAPTHRTRRSARAPAQGVLLMQLGIWNGPTVLLAPAIGLYSQGRLWLPPGDARVLLVHGAHDAIVDPADSVALAASQPTRTRLLTLDDTHGLGSCLPHLTEYLNEVRPEEAAPPFAVPAEPAGAALWLRLSGIAIWCTPQLLARMAWRKVAGGHVLPPRTERAPRAEGADREDEGATAAAAAAAAAGTDSAGQGERVAAIEKARL